MDHDASTSSGKWCTRQGKMQDDFIRCDFSIFPAFNIVFKLDGRRVPVVAHNNTGW